MRPAARNTSRVEHYRETVQARGYGVEPKLIRHRLAVHGLRFVDGSGSGA